MLSRLMVTVSVALATDDNAVPPATVMVSPSLIVCVGPESPSNDRLLNGRVLVIVMVSVADATDVIPVP